MEFLEIENTRVIHLTRVRRPAGQLYLPGAAAKLIERYSFVKSPSMTDLTERRDYVAFGIGKFLDSQIQELRIYGDGVIVEARSNSKILDAFVDDLLAWNTEEFGLETIPGTKAERYHESTIVVRSGKDLSKVTGPLREISSELNKLLQKQNYSPRPYQVSGFILDCDPHAEGGRRKELSFILDRRMGAAFAENRFFSQAPLPTDDHFALLERIETLVP